MLAGICMVHFSKSLGNTGFAFLNACRRPFRQALIALLIFLPILAQASGSDTNQMTSDLTALPLESLMEMEIPKVYGASKIEQKSSAAPASVTVINGRSEEHTSELQSLRH